VAVFEDGKKLTVPYALGTLFDRSECISFQRRTGR